MTTLEDKAIYAADEGCRHCSGREFVVRCAGLQLRAEIRKEGTKMRMKETLDSEMH